jgi:phytoene synthase
MTTTRQKLGWLSLAMLRAGASYVMPRSATIYARPLPECAFLVEAAAKSAPQRGDWSDTLYATMAQLKARDAGRGLALIDGDAGDRYRA